MTHVLKHQQGHSMSNMNHLAIAATLTLVAGFIPLIAVTSPAGVLLGEVSIALSVIGFFSTMALYFEKESTKALTWNEEDCRWH
jgi:multidrug efflux pump subunit AcrB